jgi:hypothetical protein
MSTGARESFSRAWTTPFKGRISLRFPQILVMNQMDQYLVMDAA